MTEYDIKGTHEHGSLEEVVGELNESKIPSKSRREIIIKNVKNAVLYGTVGFLGEFSLNYLGLVKPVTDAGNQIFRALVISGMLTGSNVGVEYAYRKNWSEALRGSTGAFFGFAVGYNLGDMVSQLLK